MPTKDKKNSVSNWENTFIFFWVICRQKSIKFEPESKPSAVKMSMASESGIDFGQEIGPCAFPIPQVPSKEKAEQVSFNWEQATEHPESVLMQPNKIKQNRAIIRKHIFRRHYFSRLKMPNNF